MQSDAAFDEQEDLLVLAGLGDAAAVHELQHVGL